MEFANSLNLNLAFIQIFRLLDEIEKFSSIEYVALLQHFV